MRRASPPRCVVGSESARAYKAYAAARKFAEAMLAATKVYRGSEGRTNAVAAEARRGDKATEVRQRDMKRCALLRRRGRQVSGQRRLVVARARRGRCCAPVSEIDNGGEW